MKEFLMAAYPWVIMGICLACMAVHIAKESAEKKEKSADDPATEKSYMIEGMCFGMILGSMLMFMGVTTPDVGISFGMLIGMAVGSFIKKR